MKPYLYCVAYGNGNFIVRGFGLEPFQVNGRRGEAHAAVNKAAGTGQPVTQVIALSVKDDKVECAINGTVVGSYDKSAVVTTGTEVHRRRVRHPLRAQHRCNRPGLHDGEGIKKRHLLPRSTDGG